MVSYEAANLAINFGMYNLALTGVIISAVALYFTIKK